MKQKQKKDKEIHTSLKEREMSVSLTGATVIFTLYQCCADLYCREQTDSGHTTWLTSQGHLTRSINLAVKLTHTHIANLFMYKALH